MSKYMVICIFGDGSTDYSLEAEIEDAKRKVKYFRSLGCQTKIFKLCEVEDE